MLLGYLIEKISGEPYAKFVQENIFTPLGMKDSGFDSNKAIIPHRAYGYTPGPNGPENAGFINMTIPFSAGSLYSTTEDLRRWEQGLFGGKVLTEASLHKMTTSHKNDYAFGLVVSEHKGKKVIQHIVLHQNGQDHMLLANDGSAGQPAMSSSGSSPRYRAVRRFD